MFKKKFRKSSTSNAPALLKLCGSCNLQSHSNWVLFNQNTHAVWFIEHYAKQLERKRIYALTAIDAAFWFVQLTEGSFKKSDLVVYEAESYVSSTHTVLISQSKLGQHRLEDLPSHQIIIAYTSAVVGSIEEGMSELRRTYLKKLPSGITSIDLTQKSNTVLILINNL